jgi:hypothetical protein
MEAFIRVVHLLLETQLDVNVRANTKGSHQGTQGTIVCLKKDGATC